ncbi:T9SS type A sorting domain-containing protein [Arcicella lustrica]|uniref:T9SS type A sorting domain-containing protein n=1 Tax=Arcicella lustrica TaxID=2984196 RepID=A0ABU5SGM5_9BACT|nr:T9SS type A sorting domain-containing protein [Arcicella sp. DC25W]MEA5426442.1 T9SS type A sorting domain-containing protein [Arcicella sp. DC25W]
MKHFYLLITLLFCINYTLFSQEISSNAPICLGDGLSFKVSRGKTFLWKGPNGFISNVQYPVIAKTTLENAGNYSVTIDGTTTLSIDVKIGKILTDKMYAYNSIYKNQIDFKAFANSSIDRQNYHLFKYYWNGPNNFTSNLQNPSINNFDKNAQGVYKVLIRDEFGCSSIPSTEVKFSKPDCPFQVGISLKVNGSVRYFFNNSENYSSDIFICQGSYAEFELDTSYLKNAKIKWYKDDLEINNFKETNFKTSENGVYHAVISTNTCEYKTQKLNLKNNSTPVIEISKNQTTICKQGGDDVTLISSISSFYANRLSYQWLKNDEIIEGATSHVHTTKEEGEYRLYLKADNCFVTTEPIKVVKSDKIQSKLIFSRDSDLNEYKELSLCSDKLNAFNLIGSGDGFKELSKDGLTIYSSQNNFRLSPFESSPYSPGTYILKVTQGNCVSKDSVKFSYGTMKNIPISFERVINNCSSFFNVQLSTLTLVPNRSNFTWYKNGVEYKNDYHLYPSSTGDYQLKYHDSQTGCTGESKIITIDNIYGKKIFSVNSPKGVKICKGNSYLLKLNRCYYYDNDAAVWKKDGKIILTKKCEVQVNESGKYWYEFKNDDCVYYSDTINVQVEDLVTPTITTSCLTDNKLTLVSSSIDSLKYIWFKNKEVVKNANTNTFYVDESGSYQLLKIKNGCVFPSNELIVDVFENEPQKKLSLCLDDTLKLYSSHQFASFLWVGPNNFTTTNPNPIIPKVTSAMAGTYTFTGFTQNGCKFTSQTEVKINTIQYSISLPQEITACKGSTIKLPEFSSNPSNASYNYARWEGPNNFNTTFNGDNPTLYNIVDSNSGLYKLTVYYTNNCLLKTSTNLKVSSTNDCKSISIGDIERYKSKVSCVNSIIEIPFTTTGQFPQGTKFKVISNNTILAEGLSSPLKLKIPDVYYSMTFKIVSDDNISSVSESIGVQGHYTPYLTSPLGYNSHANEIINACDSLTLYYSDYIGYKKVQWLLDGQILNNSQLNTLQATKAGTYKVKVETTEGCTGESNEIKIKLGSIYKPEIAGQTVFYCGQKSINLHSYSRKDSTKAYTFTWGKNGTNIVNESSSNLNVYEDGKYTVSFQQGSCTATSDTFFIAKSRNNKLPISIYSDGNITCTNPSTYLYCKTSIAKQKEWKLQWLKDGIAIGNNDTSSIKINDAGVYSLKAVNGTCEGVSNEIRINKIANDNIKLFYSSKEWCEGTKMSIDLYKNVSTSYFDLKTQKVIQGIIQPTEWYRDNKLINEVNTLIDSSKYYADFEYFKDTDLITTFIGREYYIYSTLNHQTPGKYHAVYTIKYDNGTECKAISDTASISFSKNVLINTNSVDPTLNVIPIVACKDTITFTSSPSSVFYDQTPIQYTWKKDGNIFKSLSKSDSTDRISTNQDGNYVLETLYQNGCKSITPPYKITLRKLNTTIYTNQSSICEGEKTAINGYINTTDTTKIQYQWIKDGKDLAFSKSLAQIQVSESGVYQLKASQGKCEGVSSTINLNFVKIPTSISPKDSITFCDNSTVELIASNETGLKYQWELNNAGIKDANVSTFKTNNSGIYRALLRKGECWDYSEKVKTIALPTILPKATLTGDQSIDYDKETKISVSLNSYAPWTLTFSDGQIFTATTSPFEVNVKPLSTTTYTLSEVKNICGIGTTEGSAKIEVIILANDIEKDINVEVYPVPTAEICNWKVSTDKPEKVYLTLYDVSGKNILEQTSEDRSQNHSGVIDLSTINAGTYFLKIDVGNKNITRKIIKY